MDSRSIQGLRVHLVQNLDVWWTHIEELVQKSVEASDNVLSLGMVREGIESNEFILWVVHDGDEIHGFYTMEFLTVSNGVVINVPFAAFYGSLRSLIFAFNHAEKVAKSAGAVGFKFISSDTRWAKLAERRGFSPRFIEYYKEY